MRFYTYAIICNRRKGRCHLQCRYAYLVPDGHRGERVPVPLTRIANNSGSFSGKLDPGLFPEAVFLQHFVEAFPADPHTSLDRADIAGVGECLCRIDASDRVRVGKFMSRDVDCSVSCVDRRVRIQKLFLKCGTVRDQLENRAWG